MSSKRKKASRSGSTKTISCSSEPKSLLSLARESQAASRARRTWIDALPESVREIVTAARSDWRDAGGRGSDVGATMLARTIRRYVIESGVNDVVCEDRIRRWLVDQ